MSPIDRRRNTIRWLLAAAIALALALVLAKLWPQRCDACGSLEFRARAVRLAPGWRVFCPTVPIQGETPRLCKRCLDTLLRMAPAHDDESRRVLAHYLTTPGIDTRLQQSIDSGLDKALKRQERHTSPSAPPTE